MKIENTYFDGSFDGCASYDCVVAVPSTYSCEVVDVVTCSTCDGSLIVVAFGSCVECVEDASCLIFFYPIHKSKTVIKFENNWILTI